MVRTDVYHSLTQGEKAVLSRLLEAEFPGRGELTQQLADCAARTIDDDGSLELRPSSRAPAPVEKTVPVEAQAADEDGIMVRFLLHVRNGFACELEVYKDDGSPILRLPDAADLSVQVLPA